MLSAARWLQASMHQADEGGGHDDLADVLGKGTHGTVVLVRTESHETVALKIWELRRGKSNQARPATHFLPEQVLTEQRVLDRVGHHPNVIEILTRFIDTSFAGFVLEPCVGSLRQAWASEQHLNEYTYARYFVEMAQALAYIHSAGVVHRDVKQDNFLLGGLEGRTVKLCNFANSAVLIGGRGLSGMVGTLPYMAPEMISSWTRHRTPVDVWSFGVIVYTAFFGCWPYQPEENTEKLMRLAILNGTVLPSFASAKGLPHNVVSEDGIRFVKALLDRNPVSRPSAVACLNLVYLKNWRHNQLKASAQVAESISLAPMLNAGARCRAFKIRPPTVDYSQVMPLMSLQLAEHLNLRLCLSSQMTAATSGSSEMSCMAQMPESSDSRGFGVDCSNRTTGWRSHADNGF